MSVNGTMVDAFKSADTDGLPDLKQLDERRQMFWVLRVGRDQLGLDRMTPGDISDVLRDAFGILIPRQRIEGTLSSESGTVAKRKTKTKRAYQLMAAGSEELDTATGGVLFIEPEHAFTGLRETHALLGALEGDLRVCDPYADARTLDMLAECDRADSIRLLTHNVKNTSGLKQTIKAFEREHGIALEVRKAPAGILHDRYTIHDDGMLLFGTSLNGLGAKQSFVVTLGVDIRTVLLAAFEATWDNAEAL